MTTKNRVRTRFSPHLSVKVNTAEFPDMAKQSMKEGTDINVIMGRYLKGGSIDHLARHGAKYGEFSPRTFHEAMNTVRAAEEMFLDLPAQTRKRFGNNPELFLEFIQNPENIPEMRKLGLALPEKKPDEIPLTRIVDKEGKDVELSSRVPSDDRSRRDG